MSRRTDPRATRTRVPREQLPAFEPVPRQYERHDGWTPDRQRRFIEALADNGSVAAAARAVDMSEGGAYHLRRQPGAQSFREAWAAALDCGVAMLEDKVMERAIHGVEVPVLSCGKQFGTRRVYNERTAMLILQARLPEKYGLQRARGMSGLDRQTLAREKRKWRQEWEREKQLDAAHADRLRAAKLARTEDDEEAVIRGINDKLEKMRLRTLEAMSPRTRAAYDEYRRLEAEDEANGYQPYDDPAHPLYAHRDGAHPSDEEDECVPLPPPGWRKGHPPEKEEPEEWPKVRSPRDEGWDCSRE